MAERKRRPTVHTTNEACWNCAGSFGSIVDSKLKAELGGCNIAKLELQLKRPPTANEVKQKSLGWCGTNNIPPNCPNGYRSPENLPLR